MSKAIFLRRGSLSIFVRDAVNVRQSYGEDWRPDLNVVVDSSRRNWPPLSMGIQYLLGSNQQITGVFVLCAVGVLADTRNVVSPGVT